MEFASCTSDDPNFGGYLITPAGSRVALVFENNLWRVPLWVPPIHVPDGHTMSVKVLIKSGTTNFLPAPCSTQDLKDVSTSYIVNNLRETVVMSISNKPTVRWFVSYRIDLTHRSLN